MFPKPSSITTWWVQLFDVGSLVVGFTPVHTPIQWVKSPTQKLVLTPTFVSSRDVPRMELLPMQKPIGKELASLSHSEMPKFTANPDNTISWQPPHAFGAGAWCIDAGGGNAVHFSPCTGEPSQLWNVLGQKNQIQLKDSHPSRCLSVSVGRSSDEDTIELRECENQATMSWKFETPHFAAAPLFSARHAMVYFIIPGMLLPLALLALLWRTQAKARALAVSQFGASMGINQGGVFLCSQPPLNRGAGPYIIAQELVPATMAVSPVVEDEAPSVISSKVVGERKDDHSHHEHEFIVEGDELTDSSREEVPEIDSSLVFDRDAKRGEIDDLGLPLVYDKGAIEAYWKDQRAELAGRWAQFLGYATPFFTKIVGYAMNGNLNDEATKGLARDARIAMEKLGPTFVKLGQVLSVRPDVLPDGAMEELTKLQDSVSPFDTTTAIQQIESELGGPLEKFFSEVSEEPVAAASLAQVYKARLATTGEYVAVKVQRPNVLASVSKDLYVLRRAAEVYQGIIDGYAPSQRTNYVALLNEWAAGFYDELNFQNEAANQIKIRQQLADENVVGLYIPKVYGDLCTRRVLVSEWMDGVKLSEAPPGQLRDLIPAAQEAFLVQLLQTGFFHADPHPGNILFLSDAAAKEKNAKLALIDFGLIATVAQEDRDSMVSAIIHLANRDYATLVDDFIKLKILPEDCNRSLVIPLMDKALTPYIKGGGAREYEKAVRKTYGMDEGNTVGGFQAITTDLLTVLNDIPFSIPPYFALLARAILTLEGIALQGNPQYGIVKEAYPFVTRKLLKEDRPIMQKALQELLYGTNGSDSGIGGLQSTRLLVLLNSALGVVAKDTDAFLDLDTLPEDGISVASSLKVLLSPNSRGLREVLTKEIVSAADVLLRQSFRKSFELLSARFERNSPISALARLPGLNQVLPQSFVEVPLPLLLPSANLSNGRLVNVSLRDFVEAATPRLGREEELYALTLVDATEQVLGKDAAAVASGDLFGGESGTAQLLLSFLLPQTKSKPLEDVLGSAGVEGVSKGILTGLLMDTPLDSSIPTLQDTLRSAPVRSLLNNVNTLLENDAVNGNSVEGNHGSVGDSSSSDILDAVSELDAEQAEILESLVNDVVGDLRTRLLNRISELH